MAVDWGREHMDLSGIEAIGIDEMQVGKGHQYVTAVYQIDEKRKRLPKPKPFPLPGQAMQPPDPEGAKG